MKNVVAEKMERKTCLHCGTPYKAKRFWSKFCSKQCRYEAWIISEANELRRKKK